MRASRDWLGIGIAACISGLCALPLQAAELQIFPKQVELSDAHARRQLVVSLDESDVTRQAIYSSTSWVATVAVVTAKPAVRTVLNCRCSGLTPNSTIRPWCRKAVAAGFPRVRLVTVCCCEKRPDTLRTVVAGASNREPKPITCVSAGSSKALPGQRPLRQNWSILRCSPPNG